jgi:hypothetical protein
MILERSMDLKEAIFTSFDPVRGRGRELFRLPLGRGSYFQSALAPDGSGVAILDSGGTSIQLFSITGRHERDINPKGWSQLGNVDWDSDGKALFVSSISPTGAPLLRVDLAGHVQVLWTIEGDIVWAIPSPDGQYLAMPGSVVDRNVWMAENL